MVSAWSKAWSVLVACVVLVVVTPSSAAQAGQAGLAELGGGTQFALTDYLWDQGDWIRVSESEAKVLEAGDDSVMDGYYDSKRRVHVQAVRPQAVERNPDGCKLTVASVHRRDSTGNIGYKPTVKCRTKPIAISLKNELQKHIVGLWWNTEQEKNYLLGTADLKRVTYRKGFTYTNIDKVCKNSTSSRWRGKTSSVIKASNGETYYARQYTREEVLSCGT